MYFTEQYFASVIGTTYILTRRDESRHTRCRQTMQAWCAAQNCCKNPVCPFFSRADRQPVREAGGGRGWVAQRDGVKSFQRQNAKGIRTAGS